MAFLDFSYDIAGHDEWIIESYSETDLIPTIESHIYTKNSGPLTFSYGIAGHQNEQFQTFTATSTEAGNKRRIKARFELSSLTSSSLKRVWNIRKSFSSSSVSWLDAETTLNLGYADDIYFGPVKLPHARYDDVDRLTFPFREKILYGGYRSIRSANVRGFTGTFNAATNDWNDIQALLDLIGTPRTLRIWGKPYRNCYIKPDIEIETVKKGLNRWYYKITFVQDSAIVGISS